MSGLPGWPLSKSSGPWSRNTPHTEWQDLAGHALPEGSKICSQCRKYLRDTRGFTEPERLQFWTALAAKYSHQQRYPQQFVPHTSAQPPPLTSSPPKDMQLRNPSVPAPKPRGRPRTNPKTHVNLSRTVAPIKKSILSSLQIFADKDRANLLKRALMGTQYAPLVSLPAVQEGIALSFKFLFDSLPHNSHFRAEFLAQMEKVSTKDMQQFFEVSARTVQRAQHCRTNMLREIQSVPHEQARRVLLVAVRSVQDFFFSFCPVSPNRVIRHYILPEGRVILRPVHYLQYSFAHIYKAYMAQGGTVGYHVLVLCMPDQIKLAKNLKALCGSCLDAKLFDKRETHARHLVEASLPDNTEANREVYAKAYIDQKEARAELANLVVERREFAEHKRIFQAQDAVYEKTKRDLQVDWGILIMDFSATRDQVSNQEPGDVWWDHNTIHWFCVVLLHRVRLAEPPPSHPSRPPSSLNPIVLDCSSPSLHPCMYLRNKKHKVFSGAPAKSHNVFDAHGRQLPWVEPFPTTCAREVAPEKYVENERKREEKKRSDLEKQPLGRHHFDWFSPHTVSNNSLFVRDALRGLLLGEQGIVAQYGFRGLHIFSDGGPKHFKLRRTIFYIWELCQELNIPIRYHFFCSCHGKCECDGHYGVSKACHLALVKQGVKFRCARFGCVDYVDAQNDNVPDTTASLLLTVETPPRDVDAFKSIALRSGHRFDFFPGDENIHTYDVSTAITFVTQKISPISVSPEEYTSRAAAGTIPEVRQRFHDFSKSLRGQEMLLQQYQEQSGEGGDLVVCDICFQGSYTKRGLKQHQRSKACKAVASKAAARTAATTAVPTPPLCAQVPSPTPVPVTAPGGIAHVPPHTAAPDPDPVLNGVQEYNPEVDQVQLAQVQVPQVQDNPTCGGCQGGTSRYGRDAVECVWCHQWWHLGKCSGRPRRPPEHVSWLCPACKRNGEEVR